MTEQTTSDYGSAGSEPPRSGWAVGFTMFAGIIMIMAGAFRRLPDSSPSQKTSSTRQRKLHRQVRHHQLGLDPPAAWTLVLFAGFAVLSGKVWARTIAVILAVLSALSMFGFIPYYPFWAIVIIALDVFVIWALTAHGRDITR